MGNIYESGQYLAENPDWGATDSPWKAREIVKLIQRGGLEPKRVVEIGCGAGLVLKLLSERFGEAEFSGYDISPQAISIARQHAGPRLHFHQEDALSPSNTEHFDLLLAIDVFEHVPDYLGFLEKCRGKANWKAYHIPLEVNVSAVLRNTVERDRYLIGHLHYFTAAGALAALRDTGHEIVDHFYTASAIDLFWKHPTTRKAIANAPRWLLSKVDISLAARLLGGFSLMVLAK
jgi:SAM-dependent methyltransferase